VEEVALRCAQGKQGLDSLSDAFGRKLQRGPKDGGSCPAKAGNRRVLGKVTIVERIVTPSLSFLALAT